MNRLGFAGLAAMALIAASAGAQDYGSGRGRGGYYDDRAYVPAPVPGAEAAIEAALYRERERYGFRAARYERDAFISAVNGCGYEADRETRGGPIRVIDVERIGDDAYAVDGVIGGDDSYDGDPHYERLAFKVQSSSPLAEGQDPNERYYTPKQHGTPAPPVAAPPVRVAPSPPVAEQVPPPDQGAIPDGSYDAPGGNSRQSYRASAGFRCVARGDGRIASFDFSRG